MEVGVRACVRGKEEVCGINRDVWGLCVGWAVDEGKVREGGPGKGSESFSDRALHLTLPSLNVKIFLGGLTPFLYDLTERVRRRQKQR